MSSRAVGVSLVISLLLVRARQLAAEEAVEVVLRDAYVDADVGKQLGERQPALPKLTRGAIEAPLAGGAADR